LGIGSILFLILRFASLSNPIAASVFSVFEMILSWGINFIKIIAPKALNFAGATSTLIFEKYKGTMKKLVDGIETLQERQKSLGEINKKYTLDELMVEFSKLLNDEEKALISKTKQEIGYK